MIRFALVFAALAAVPALFGDDKQPEPVQASAKPNADAAQPPTKPAASQPATVPSADGLHPHVTLETTLGNIVLELDGEKAPISTKNFIDYVEAGFYNGTIFHRVMPDFMIQGGGYTPDLTEKRDGLRPPIRNEWQNGLKNQRGTIAMARTMAPDSATAQFFINVVDNTQGNPHDLDTPRGGAAYAVFGRVIEGMDAVDKIKATEVVESPKLPMGKVVPKEPVVIKSAKLTGSYDKAKLAARTEGAAKPAAPPAAASAAGQDQAVQEFIKKVEAETGKKVEKTGSGLMYVILQEGTGPTPKRTDLVDVHYTGTFLDGRKFDSSLDTGRPYSFSLPGGVIQGWLEGVALMKVGEKRKFIIPPNLAYGAEGRLPTIPPNTTLVFDIELLKIRGPQ